MIFNSFISGSLHKQKSPIAVPQNVISSTFAWNVNIIHRQTVHLKRLNVAKCKWIHLLSISLQINQMKNNDAVYIIRCCNFTFHSSIKCSRVIWKVSWVIRAFTRGLCLEVFKSNLWLVFIYVMWRNFISNFYELYELPLVEIKYIFDYLYEFLKYHNNFFHTRSFVEFHSGVWAVFGTHNVLKCTIMETVERKAHLIFVSVNNGLARE